MLAYNEFDEGELCPFGSRFTRGLPEELDRLSTDSADLPPSVSELNHDARLYSVSVVPPPEPACDVDICLDRSFAVWISAERAFSEAA